MRALACIMAALCLPVASVGSFGFSGFIGFIGFNKAAAAAGADPASQPAVRCGSGNAGHYEVTEFVDRTTLVGDGHLIKRIDVPRASCYPSCRREQADNHTYRIEDPSGDELINPSLRDDDAIEPVRGSSATLHQIDAATLQLAVQTQGRAHVWFVEADKVRRAVTSQKETTIQGKLAYNDPFFIVFNHAALPTLILTVDGSTVELGPSELDLNQLPSWLVETVAPQQLGVSMVYTLKVVDGPGCTKGD
jgi:hypothetical protein